VPAEVNDEEAARLLAVLNTNSHELGEWGGSGFFPLACLSEHSCQVHWTVSCLPPSTHAHPPTHPASKHAHTTRILPTCTYARTHAHTLAHTHTHTHTCTNTLTHTHEHAHTHAHTHAHMHTHTHEHAHTHAHAHTHTHTHTHTHSHTSGQLRLQHKWHRIVGDGSATSKKRSALVHRLLRRNI